MSWFEKKFGKYAISNISLMLILCYAVGYVLQIISPAFLNFLTLNPYAILHGQIWRVLTWILVPPDSLDIFTLLMLYFYYSVGTSLERYWGTYQYNVYLLRGMLLTVLTSFLVMGVSYILYGEMLDVQVLLMFVIPVKMKWMGVVYGVMLMLQLVDGTGFPMGNLFYRSAIGVSLLNFAIFFLMSRNKIHMTPKQMKRRQQFKQEVKRNTRITKHKCAICGRTDEDDETLEFGFCSKCEGNYDYCQYHLFTHEHVKK